MASNQTFDTLDGSSITEGLQELAEQFDLEYQYGTAPQDYTITRYVCIRISPAYSDAKKVIHIRLMVRS